MMYRVVFEHNSIQRVLFRSLVESECWAFIESRRNCFIPKIRDETKYYIVLDALDQKYRISRKAA